MLVEWVAGKCYNQNINIHIYSISCQKKGSYLAILILCGCLQEEFGTLKPWYDHIGGDAIGLTWNKHNAKVKVHLKIFCITTNKKQGKIETNVCLITETRTR